jgi:tetratricopeptide (TPR) repeat protein
MARDADRAFQEASTLHGEGRLADAERRYRAALAVEPGHAGALCYLGLLTAQLGRLDDGAALLRQSIERNPGGAEAHNHLGAVLQQLGRHREAVVCHERAIALVTNYPDARLNLAAAQQALGRPLEAIGGLRQLLADHPDFAAAQYNLGLALDAVGKRDEAVTHLRKAAALDPALAARLTGLLDPPGAGTRPAAAGAPPNAALQPPTPAAMQRMNQFMGGFLTNRDNPRMTMYPGLTARAVHDPAQFAAVRALEAAFDAIKREVATLADTVFHPEAEGLDGTQGWDVLLLYERGRKNAENCALCPVITNIIESHATVRTLAGLMYVSKTNPGTHIKPHLGPTNVRLRCHLGIKVPEGDCGLRVDGQPVRWTEGSCIVFDDHLEHESWNFTAEPRIVLIIDLWHPDLTPPEIALLEGLHRYAAYQGMSLNRYWSRNKAARNKARAAYD